MRRDLSPGATFPDYELPDHHRVLRQLSWDITRPERRTKSFYAYSAD